MCGNTRSGPGSIAPGTTFIFPCNDTCEQTGPAGRIRTGTPMLFVGCGCHDTAGSSSVTQRQSSRNDSCMFNTAGPSTRTCASRQPSDSYSSAMFRPPTQPTLPSAITSLRWLRKFSRARSLRRLHEYYTDDSDSGGSNFGGSGLRESDEGDK